MIPKFVFRGFEKACHFEYKFDSKTEQDFAYVLENEVNVRRWLRPAPNQFRIYWDNNSKRYEPDFVVETTNCIYMIETKAEKIWITMMYRQRKKRLKLIASLQRNIQLLTVVSLGNIF